MRFARFFSLLSMTLAAFLLAACSGGKPESVVETFYEAAAKGDVDKAVAQISFAGVPAEQMAMAKGKIQMVVGEMQNRIKANDGLKEVKIVDAKVDGDKAVISAVLVFKNGKEQKENNINLAKENGDWKMLLK